MSHGQPSAQRARTEALHKPETGVCENRIAGSSRSYASELARYIRCPSTIRARVLDQFGYAPSLAECRNMREKRVAEREQYRLRSDAIETLPQDRHDFRVRGLVKIPRRSRALTPLAIGEEEELPENAPIATASPAVLPSEIIMEIAKAFGIQASDILGKSRKRKIMLARRTVMFILRERGNSFPNVGRHLGGVDHATVIHGHREFCARASDAMRLIAARYLPIGDKIFPQATNDAVNGCPPFLGGTRD